MWLLVPGAVSITLLVCWRWGPWGLLVPVGSLGAVAIAGADRPWGWWLPVAALSGAWMGLREEGGGPSSGQRAWMLLPLLVLASGLPGMPGYPELVSRLQAFFHAAMTEAMAQSRQMGYPRDQLELMQRGFTDLTELSRRVLPNALPSLLFLWMAFLISAGRALAARHAGWMRWPEMSRSRLADWRLPDGAIWVLMAGLALLLTSPKGWAPTGWTLLVVPALGYCLQGIAVVESLLLARGVSPSIIALTLLFVFVMALPVFLLSTACVGLSDIWLDYRRLEEDRGAPSS